MKFCSHCGAELNDNAAICLKCGCFTNAYIPNHQSADAPNAGFALLSFFFPVIGLVLYWVWLNTTPLRAKSCGKGALIGAIVKIVSIILTIVLITVISGAIGETFTDLVNSGSGAIKR